jgi:hypothetical protein
MWTLRPDRHARGVAAAVRAEAAAAMNRVDRAIARWEERCPAYGPILGILLALRFYADPDARVVWWRRDEAPSAGLAHVVN